MNTTKHSTWRTCGLPVLILAVVVVGIIVIRIGGWLYFRSIPCPPGAEVCLEFDVEGNPTLGNPVYLLVGLETRRDSMVESDIWFHIPEGVEILDGQQEFRTTIIPEQQTVERILIRTSQPGEWAISVLAKSVDYGEVLDEKVLYIISTETDAQVSEKATPNHWYPPNMASGYVPQETGGRYSSKLSVQGEPSLNQEFKILYSVTASQNEPMAQIGIILPFQGWEIVNLQKPSDDLNIQTRMGGLAEEFWSGQLHSNQTITITETLKISDVGQGGVYGYIRSGEDGEDGGIIITQMVTDGLYFKINKLVGTYHSIPKREAP